MKPSFAIIPLISIHPTSINLYNEIHWSPYRPSKPKFDHLTISDKKTHGHVSVQARRKLSKAIDYLLFLAADKALPDTAHGKKYNFKIAFVTLTLPSSQIHSDNEIKDQLLNQFLIELKFRHHVHNYIWRAEKQKNGNIHFHILIDKFISWSVLRDRWNRICNKLGYVDRYRDEMRTFHKSGFKIRQELLEKWDYKSQIKAYQKGKLNDWNSPNSTDIHSLYKIHRIKEYITKYCTKDENYTETHGRLWGCSVNLSHIKGATTVLISELKFALDELIAQYKPTIYTSDYFSVIKININQLSTMHNKLIYNLFCNYMSKEFNHNMQTNISI